MKRLERVIEWGKTALILLLTLSAVYLLLRSGLLSAVPSSGGLLSFFFSDESDADAAAPSSLADLFFPGRAVVTHGGERFGVQYDDDTLSGVYADAAPLLLTALDGVAAPVQIAESQWRAALSCDGLYLDYLGPVPLCVLLSEREELALPDALLTVCARYVLLSTDGAAVTLCYQDDADGLYYRCAVSTLTPAGLSEALSGYYDNSAFFAFESDQYDALSPYTLLGVERSAVPGYTAAAPLAGLDESGLSSLLPLFSFSRQTSTLYPVSDGIRVRDSSDSLSFSTVGSVAYHAADDLGRYPACADLPALMRQVYEILSPTLLSWLGEGRLYLSGLEGSLDGTLTLCFDYAVNGVPVYLSGEQCAAQFTVTDGQLTGYVFHPRAYAADGSETALLPVRQAMAILRAQGLQGSALTLCYEDAGDGALAATWIAE